MKTVKRSLMAIALTIGIAGSFAFHAKAHPVLNDPLYNWSENGKNPFQGTVAQAEEYYGCHGGTLYCANGNLVPGQMGAPTARILTP